MTEREKRKLAYREHRVKLRQERLKERREKREKRELKIPWHKTENGKLSIQKSRQKNRDKILAYHRAYNKTYIRKNKVNEQTTPPHTTIN